VNTLQNSTIALLKNIWRHLSTRRKLQLIMLVFLMTAASIAEVISIGSALPFLAILMAPDKLFSHDLAQPLVQILKIESSVDLIFPITLFFIVTVILAGLVRIFMLWAQTQLSMSIGADFSVKVFENILYRPYSFHLSRNSSELLSASQKAKEMVIWFLQPCLVLLSSLIIMLAIATALFFIDSTIAVSLFLGFGLIYISIILTTRRYISKNSQILSIQYGIVTKAVQEGLGGIRDVIIDGTQPVYSKLYRDALIPMQKAQASNHMIGGCPRFAVEALGMVLIAGLAYFLADLGGQSAQFIDAIPALGAMAIGAQRLLPVLQQSYNAYIYLRGNQLATQDALELLDQSIPQDALLVTDKPIFFTSSISVKNLSFQYVPDGPLVLNNLSFEIPKGAKVGFVGATGCGKSTLLDMVMGLLSPTTGAVCIDGVEIDSQNRRSWQANIAHVPQHIFLTDNSVAENIAFGVPKALINMERVKEAAQLAQIALSIESWQEAYKTVVGDRGLRLSGGQRQRIGIARALYKRSKVIILDEATSALDHETEAAVMLAIEALGRDTTTLIIAHRLSTLKNCDFILNLANGSILAINDYESLISNEK
jgi:ABC-type multidrug transport system fused ATPase/permease subunit